MSQGPQPHALPHPGSRPGHVPLRLLLTVLGTLALLSGAIVFLVIVRRHNPETTPPVRPPEDPRVQYTGPFQNIHPDVAYVGEEQCADCHQAQTAPFHRHAMGRSLLPVSQIAAEQTYDQAHYNPFDAFDSRFLVERRGDQVRHKRTVLGQNGEPVGETEFQVDYVIGSGTHGYSYLTNRDGYLFQTPISWFSQKQRWDKSPSFDHDMLSGRPIAPSCLFCHANHVNPRDGYLNRFETPLFEGHAIGCEPCHGPGALHIRNPGRRDPETNIDYTIVNPKHLQPELRAAVCEQCHLEGEARVVRHYRGLFDYRPGLPLQPFWSVFVHAAESGEDYKAVNHVEQMYQSACFQRSADDPREGRRKMGCTSCHDPHQRVAPAEHVTHYREACLACHANRGCSIPEAERLLTSKQDSCIDCHMRPYNTSDIAHTASTDHRILRKQGQTRLPDANLLGAGLPLVPFYPDQRKSDDPEVRRDLALALIRHAARSKTDPSRDLREAVKMLDAALARDPNDVEAHESRAHALTLLGEPAEALAAIEAALERAPHREAALAGAAKISLTLKQRDQAIVYWHRAIEANPWMPQYRQGLALLLEQKQAWEEIRPECQAWMRLDPSSVDARRLWVACLLRDGKSDEAKAEFAKIEQLHPPNLEELKAWFTVKSRPR